MCRILFGGWCGGVLVEGLLFRKEGIVVVYYNRWGRESLWTFTLNIF